MKQNKRIVGTIWAMVAVAILGISACDKDEKETEQPSPTTQEQERPEGAFAIRFLTPDGNFIYDGDTAVYICTDDDLDMPPALIDLYLENQTEEALELIHEWEQLEGTTEVPMEICANGTCPYNNSAYTLQPGRNTDKPYSLHPTIDREMSGHSLLFVVRTAQWKGRTPQEWQKSYVKVVIP